MSLEEQFLKHTEDDAKSFKALNELITTNHEEQQKVLVDIQGTLTNLAGVSDFFKGVSLLKKPLMLFVAVVIGLVALMGGLKTIVGWFIIK